MKGFESSEWVVPILRDVAAFLRKNGLEESSTFVSAAAEIVQREQAKMASRPKTANDLAECSKLFLVKTARENNADAELDTPELNVFSDPIEYVVLTSVS